MQSLASSSAKGPRILRVKILVCCVAARSTAFGGACAAPAAAAPEAQPTPAEPEPSYLDELERLAGLRDKGIVSDEEFEAKKKQLLGL